MSSAAAPRTCASCGSTVASPEARFCERCGARLAEAPSPEPVPDPFGDVAARFGALAGRPDVAELLRQAPAVPELSGSAFLSALALLGFGVAGVLLSFLFFYLCPPLGVLPLALVAFGGYALGRRLLWTVRAPLVAHAALVRETRARLQVGAEHSPAGTRHFATLEFGDGRRSEHECFPSAAGGLSAGAIGVAYLKGDRLAAFARVPV